MAIAPATTLTRLSDVRALARLKVGIASGAADADDPYLDEWPTAVNAARDQLLMELPARRVAGASEIEIPVTAEGAYDLSAYGFLRVDRMGLEDGTTTAWVDLYGPAQALVYASTTDGTTGTPNAVTWDGRILCLLPWEDDTTKTLVVQGVRVPDLLEEAGDGHGLTRTVNEALATGAAIRIIQYDIEREDHFQRRLPFLMGEWDRLTRNLRFSLLNNRRERGGWKTATGVNDAQAAGDRIPAASATLPTGTTVITLRYSDWQYATGGEVGVSIDVSDYPVADGHESGVTVTSAWTGAFTGTVTVNGTGTLITAGTGTNPDTSSPFVLAANEPYRALYMSESSA